MSTRPSIFTVIFFQIARVVVYIGSRLLWRITIEGKENLPKSGSFVVVPNHRSYIDSPICALVSRRRMRYIGKAEWFHSKLLSRVYLALGAFPVKRGMADRDGLRLSKQIIEDGYPLVVFAEGTRKSGPVIEKIMEGAAYLALNANVPMIPMGIGGSEKAMPPGKFFRFAKVHMVIGKPIPPHVKVPGRPTRNEIKEQTKEVQAAMQEVFDRARAKSS